MPVRNGHRIRGTTVAMAVLAVLAASALIGARPAEASPQASAWAWAARWGMELVYSGRAGTGVGARGRDVHDHRGWQRGRSRPRYGRPRMGVGLESLWPTRKWHDNR